MSFENYLNKGTIAQRSPFDAFGKVIEYDNGSVKNSISDRELPPPPYSIDAGRCETESNDFFSGRSDPKISQSSNGKGHGSKESNQKIIKNVNDDGSQQNDNDKGNTDDDGSKSKRCNSGSISERKNETEGT